MNTIETGRRGWVAALRTFARPPVTTLCELCGAPLDSLPLPPAEPLRPIPLHRLKQGYAAVGGAWLRFRDRLESLPRSSVRKASS